jgi:alpha-beta hydrolase superfamily lysophospholipase
MTTMEPTPFPVEASDGTRLAGYRWCAQEPARGVVVIAHGLGEHALRYAHLAAALTGAGLDVVAADHRGHGATAATDAELGSFGPGGWEAVVEDFGRVVERAAARRPGRPVVVLGHSLGSFLLQTYLLDHSDRVAGAVLSGSAALDEVAVLLDPEVELDLAAFNAPFQPARTDFDWLSRDPAQVDAYIDDPRCGFGLDPAGVRSLKAAAARTADPEALAGLRRGFPLYILSGTDDPLHAGLAWLEKLVGRYREAGLEVTARYYDGGRHELFNETNRDEVVAELEAWLNRLPALSQASTSPD